MKKGILIILLINLGFLQVYGQDLKGLKKIIKYEESIIRKYSLLDSNGNIIFNKNVPNIAPISVSAIYYDKSNKELKTLTAHANVGFSIYTYEYDNLDNETKVYKFNDLEENILKVSNDGPFNYVVNYSSRKDLENDPSIIKMFESDRKYLISEFFYDERGNKIKETNYKENGDTLDVKRNIYNKNGNLIKSQYSHSKSVKNLSYQYDMSGNEIYTICIRDFGKRKDTIDISKFKDNKILMELYKDALNDTAYIIKSYYDSNNNLTEQHFWNKNEIENIEKSYYQNNKIVKKEIYDSNNNIIREQTYEYNNKGQVIRETDNYPELNRKHEYLWKYEYY